MVLQIFKLCSFNSLSSSWGLRGIPTFSVNMKHSVESCPLFNPEVMGRFKEVIGRRHKAAKKHGISVLSAWPQSLTT
jgi:hypothetical protein